MRWEPSPVTASLSQESDGATGLTGSAPGSTAVAEAERAVAQLKSARAAIGQVIYGQNDVVDECLITLLAGGHALLVGVPGLAKTRLVHTLGTVLGLGDKRVQFTPDLMPA
ncbi:MAG: AAA family ATPase, partial [Rhodobacteraceae bacterium]|nr:AAA family ATPase [Paracoccaceae bacterium]